MSVYQIIGLLALKIAGTVIACLLAHKAIDRACDWHINRPPKETPND